MVTDCETGGKDRKGVKKKEGRKEAVSSSEVADGNLEDPRVKANKYDC